MSETSLVVILVIAIALVFVLVVVLPLAFVALMVRRAFRRQPERIIVIEESDSGDPGQVPEIRADSVTSSVETESIRGAGGKRIGLIGCVKQKRSAPAPARDLYTSALFRGRRRCVEASCDAWYVLSALHGLVAPDDVIEPYDVTLKSVGARERRAWTKRMLSQIDGVLGDVAGVTFEIHAGNDYCGDGLLAGLAARGARVDRRMVGLSFGKQLERYSRGDCDGGGPVEGPAGSVNPDAATRSSARSMTRPETVPEHRQASRPRSTRPRSKYAPLFDYLSEARGEQVALTFGQIEAILGFPLPASARNHQAWWASDPKHSHATSWLYAGLRASPNLTGETVTFRQR